MPLDQKFLDDVLSANRREGATWQAGPTSMLNMTAAERDARLGYVPGPGELSLSDRERIAASNQNAQPSTKALPGALAGCDWRNVGDAVYISGVKDQGSCGSCVAFGTTATIEAAVRITCGIPVNYSLGANLQDLSDAQLFYCGAEGQYGRSCATGWYVSQALDYATSTGIAPEAYFPYEAGDQPCGIKPGWENKLTVVSKHGVMQNFADMKQWLSTRGPLITAFSVYSDFFSYNSGVYRER